MKKHVMSFLLVDPLTTTTSQSHRTGNTILAYYEGQKTEKPQRPNYKPPYLHPRTSWNMNIKYTTEFWKSLPEIVT